MMTCFITYQLVLKSWWNVSSSLQEMKTYHSNNLYHIDRRIKRNLSGGCNKLITHCMWKYFIEIIVLSLTLCKFKVINCQKIFYHALIIHNSLWDGC